MCTATDYMSCNHMTKGDLICISIVTNVRPLQVSRSQHTIDQFFNELILLLELLIDNAVRRTCTSFIPPLFH